MPLQSKFKSEFGVGSDYEKKVVSSDKDDMTQLRDDELEQIKNEGVISTT